MAAICQYEIFLRAYVIGLSLAGSPYAFHAIGSTMACTAQAYVDVRGMNRRTAAEDFHFLNKLAKIGGVGTIGATTVFPSPRESARVPFGTGRAMLKVTGGAEGEWRLHDPRIFTLLGQWLAAVNERPDREAAEMVAVAMKIHPGLAAYLEQNRFDAAWHNIRRNCPDESHLVRGFHVWFDGLKTLRFVHHLSRTAFPPVPLVRGVPGLLDRAGRIDSAGAIFREFSGSDAPFRILEALRRNFPGS
jgi:hypothetical protein